MDWKDFIDPTEQTRLDELDNQLVLIADQQAEIYLACYHRYIQTVDGVVLKTGRGDLFVISPEDVDRVNQHKWQSVANRSGDKFRLPYVAATIDGKRQYLHRFLTDAPQGKVVDHRDNVPLNNTRGNLRVVTQGNNSKFSVKHRKSGGLSGVALAQKVSTCV